MPDAKPQQPVNKWIQSVFWFISCLPSFQHIPRHAADDYVGRTSPLLGTAFAFWIVGAAVIALVLISNGTLLPNLAWRHMDTITGVSEIFLGVIYIAGFWMFANREDDYPN